MNTIMFIFNLINKGGPINWIITFGYFLSFTIILEKIIYFYKTRYNMKMITTIFPCGNIKNISKNKIFQKFRQSQVIQILGNYINNMDKKKEIFNEIVEEKGMAIIKEMDSRLWILSEIGHITPLLGLLGTVTGLIKAFHKITILGGDVDVMVLAGGIWEAMLTTANGLIVAIPSFLAYKFFQKVVDNRSDDMSIAVSKFNVAELLSKKIKFNRSFSSKGEIIDDEV